MNRWTHAGIARHPFPCNQGLFGERLAHRSLFRVRYLSVPKIWRIDPLLRFFKKNWMFTAALVLAVASMFAVPPDAAYLDYFDWKTIGCLFCILAVASAFRRTGAFDDIARRAIERTGSIRRLVISVIAVTAVLSMAFTNDVALIIMLPLALALVMRLRRTDMIPMLFSLQTLAANLCGMITPFGNPQNIYLCSFYGIGLGDFLSTMLLPFLLSTVAILVIAFIAARDRRGNDVADSPKTLETGSSTPTEAAGSAGPEPRLNKGRLGVYGALFLIALLAVFSVIPFWISVIIIALALAVLDPVSLARVDYGLLATFLCFFIFAGNIARIPGLEALLAPLMDQWGLLVSSLTSQVISNVPAAVVLSHFTQDWPPLLIGVNIGGAGTFVGSLASLITIRFFLLAHREFLPTEEARTLTTKRFLGVFALMNAAFLVVLLVIFQWLSVLP